MERTKLKDLVRTLELTLDALKAEVYSDVDSYKNEQSTPEPLLDYDEMFDGDSD